MPARMQNILVAIDFSDVTREILDAAALLAGPFGSKVWLVHVAGGDPAFVGYEAGPQSVRDERAEELRAEHRRVEALAEELRLKGVAAGALYLQGPTVETILEQAGDWQADLIVLGSHGHGALYKTLLGSVSEGILRKAPCPVLIVPSGPPRA